MSWIAVSIGGGLAAGGLITSATAGRDKVQNDWLANPEYPHSQDSRDLWWQKLQDWGKDPNYGAIAPDWNDIWHQTQQKVKGYYNGTAMAPGVQDRVNSSLARRGMSENPASDFLHAQVGAQESQDLGNLSAQQNIAQNQFAEQGRNDWLSSLQNFQAQKPAGQWSSQQNPNNQRMVGDSISKIGGAIGSAGMSAYGNQQQLDYLKNYSQQPQSFSAYDIYGY